MVNLLLKKSYLRKNLKETNFKDLWVSHGVFTTMWIFGKPAKILFFKKHIKNLIRSIKIYKINRKNIEKNILKIIKINLKNNKKYDHLLRIAVNNKIISFSLRKRLKPKLKFSVKLINYKRIQPEFKNLKYKKILKYLSKIDTSDSDIFLCNDKKIMESGTSNILFVKKNKIFSPIKNFYKGITFKFFEKKLKKIIKKNIFINTLNNYDEIILIGSGKGVVSVESVKKPKWKRKSLKTYRFLSTIYNQAVTKCPLYYG
jgi:branched-subunit amino acid aminotransferase/4-amino-4-deoxychorismate lyase